MLSGAMLSGAMLSGAMLSGAMLSSTYGFTSGTRARGATRLMFGHIYLY
jgi:uncharacterized protein YjbI with pentapeptide repeats